MAELTKWQIEESDIDWYCLVNGQPTHIASMGGMIPMLFRERESLRKLQDAVANIQPFTEAKLNMNSIQTQIGKGYEYLQDRMIREAIEDANRNNPGFQYLEEEEFEVRLFASTFAEKARRGFRSYARKEGVEGNEYVLIAEPDKRLDYKAWNYQLLELVCDVKDDGGHIAF